jgi:hypothetical protein
MTDRYVYYFTTLDRQTGENIRSECRATLRAIEGKGEPLMESQIVVDHTELDHNEFLLGIAGENSDRTSDLMHEIRSLELRADSRDSGALTLDAGTEAENKYMLSLESRELRKQARELRQQRTDLADDALDVMPALGDFGGNPATG